MADVIRPGSALAVVFSGVLGVDRGPTAPPPSAATGGASRLSCGLEGRFKVIKGAVHTPCGSPAPGYTHHGAQATRSHPRSLLRNSSICRSISSRARPSTSSSLARRW